MDESRRKEVGKAIGSKGPYDILILLIIIQLVILTFCTITNSLFTALIPTLIRSIK